MVDYAVFQDDYAICRQCGTWSTVRFGACVMCAPNLFFSTVAGSSHKSALLRYNEVRASLAKLNLL